jgi:hypothetical protein
MKLTKKIIKAMPNKEYERLLHYLAVKQYAKYLRKVKEWRFAAED